MNDLTERPAKRASLIEVMAEKYNMDPDKFAAAVRRTAMPSEATNEEFAAFLMVAKEYRLNPLLREIHAFPRRGGGVMPVVSIDGWVSLINQHPQANGFEFDMHHNDKQQLVACTCRMFRKDRSLPVSVTEYFIECYRNTEAWKMPHRMLRHKTLIQAARYCFGFSGIYDDDEAERIAEIKDVTPPPSGKAALDHFAMAQSPAMDAADIVDNLPAEDPQLGPPEAYEAGRAARDENKALRAIPGAMRLDQALADAWQDGWRARDGELSKVSTAS